MQATWRDIEILAKTVYGEARGEERVGKHAVVWVVLNRFNSKRWYAEKTIAGTCLKRRQFSCWNEFDPMREKVVNLTPQRGANCLEAVLDVVLRGTTDPTGGATFYLNPEATRALRGGTLPDWAEKKPSIAVIGRHHFFTDPDL